MPGGSQQQRTRNSEQSVGLSMMVQYGMNKVTTTTAPATTQGTQSVVGEEYQSNNNGSSNRIRPGERHDNDSESNQSTTSRAGSCN